jgi:PKD repeat protein
MEKQIAHVFDSPGTYHVSLRIHSYDYRLWGEFMFDWAYLTITVVNPGAPLEANADGSDLGEYETLVDEEIQFYGIASGGIQPYTYEWDFGDGATFNEQNPVHVYNTEGVYTTTFTVTDSVGSIASDTVEVIVYSSDEIVVSIDADSKGIVGFEMFFNSIVHGGTEPYIYSWDFGDGTPINHETNPGHIFENSGIYFVTLTVTDNVGKTNDAITSVEIEEESVSAKINQVTGGLGIKATITAGDYDCDWTIKVDGKYFLSDGIATGMIPANTQETVILPSTIAFGKVTINVIANVMQKKFTAFALGPFFLNLKEASVIVLAGGPRDKAIGFLYLEEPEDVGYRQVSLRVFEESGDKPASGVMNHILFDPDGRIQRNFQFDVVYVNISDNVAQFGAECIYDSYGEKTGEWLYVQAYGHEPSGTKGDLIGWIWESENQVQNWVDNNPPVKVKVRVTIRGHIKVNTY